MLTGWIGRVEVPAPGLDHAEVAKMVQREKHRPIAAGGKTHDRATATVRQRPVVRIHIAREVARNRRLPVPPLSPVQVLAVPVAVPGTLRRDQDRVTADRTQSIPEETDAAIRKRRRR